MTRHVIANALLQELRIPVMVLTFAEFHAQLDNGGDSKTALAFILAIIHGRPLLKTASRFARSHARLANGGKMKTNLAAISVMLHGFKALPPMVFPLALDLANMISSGDLMIRPVLLNV